MFAKRIKSESIILIQSVLPVRQLLRTVLQVEQNRSLTPTKIYLLRRALHSKSQNRGGGYSNHGLVSTLISLNIGAQSNTNIQLSPVLLEIIWQFQQPLQLPSGYSVMEVILLRRSGTSYHRQQLDIYFAYGIGVRYRRQTVTAMMPMMRQTKYRGGWSGVRLLSIASFLYTLFYFYIPYSASCIRVYTLPVSFTDTTRIHTRRTLIMSADK